MTKNFSLRIPFSARNMNFVRQREGAGGRLLLSPACDTVPLKQDKSQQETSQWKNHYAIWTAGLPIISLTKLVLFLLFKNHFSSFSSLQDGRISTV
jgi:hypothetical protein